ncbi:unnamed protein product [Didymodactylos carnosus]|uniref:Dopey N-terminal domain-containing protein n=1 Tax=Didymodactylos carnosus TaxID=1234261 RepID=A0A814JLG9_9BILA|nr:unnamed protein product [Didymodactylos carnosus]CAF3811095.1 unnamed protein product [Didymodactylos carnosus]
MSLMSSDEVALLNDARYKNFISTLEKVLKQFEYSSEWADLITNLVKVKKTIENYPKFQSIPKRITLSKRLAQCLHPALPSGVHLKALEVYASIFQMIGKRNLQRDIILYSLGLFPLLPSAALPVKPVLLSLYETYLLPLGESLNPVLIDLFLGLFPALEEGSDYFDRTYQLLDNILLKIDKFYFYSCIWSAMHLLPSARYPAIIYILSHFDRRKSMEDQLHLMGLSIETLVSAVCVCLQDTEQSLVQRSILDFLLTCLPMNNKQLTKIDLMKIITVSLNILLKRNMSLNRRIYSWFLDSEQLPLQAQDSIVSTTVTQTCGTSTVAEFTYFTQYTHDNLIHALINALESMKAVPLTYDTIIPITIDTMSSSWTLTKLLRVLIILVDKPDVGPNILEYVLMNYLLIVYKQVYFETKVSSAMNIQQENQRSETLKTLNVLLDTFEPYFIWEFLTKNFDLILTQTDQQQELVPFKLTTTGGATIETLCGVIQMLLDIASLDSSPDIQIDYLPEMLYHLIKIMNTHIVKFSAQQISVCVQTLLKILKKVVSSDTRHLSIFRRSTINERSSLIQKIINDDSVLEDEKKSASRSDDDEENVNSRLINENDYSMNVYNKLIKTNSIGQLQQSSLIIDQCSVDVERLLRHMVRTIEKQVYIHIEPVSTSTTSSHKLTRTSTSINKNVLKSINHIEKTLNLYKAFFHCFITTFIISNDSQQIKEKFKKMYSLTQKKTHDNICALFNQYYRQQTEFSLKLNDNVELYRKSFEDCCKLLVDLCCFPRQFTNDNTKQTPVADSIEFDDWCMDLCVLSICCSNHFSIQTISISVLIELVDYSLCLYCSSNNVSKSALIDQQKLPNTSLIFHNLPTTPKTIDNSIVPLTNSLNEHIPIFPPFTQDQVNFLTVDTLYFQHVTSYLWEHLSDEYQQQYNIKSSRLLLMLHSMLPSRDCEDMICNQLSSTHIQQYDNEFQIIESYKRFFKLWNSTRDLLSTSTLRLTKTFERCLLIVLSILNESNNHCLKLMVQQWICDRFIQGDMYRIFDILFIMLLHPDTARISIQKLNPINHRDYFQKQISLVSPEQSLINSNFKKMADLDEDEDDGDINKMTFQISSNTFDDMEGEDTFVDEHEIPTEDDLQHHEGDTEATDEDPEAKIGAISCESGEVVYHVKQSSPNLKSQVAKANKQTTLSLSQPVLTNPVIPPINNDQLKVIKRRAPTLPPNFHNKSINTITHDNTNLKNNNNSKMFSSVHEDLVDNPDASVTTKPDLSYLLSVDLKSVPHLNNSSSSTYSRRPHSAGSSSQTFSASADDIDTIPITSLSESNFLTVLVPTTTSFNQNTVAKQSRDMTLNSSSATVLAEKNKKIDGHLAYILLYTQPYDYNRVLFSMTLIESLIDLIPKQLIQTLSYTNHNKTSTINIHNSRMYELYTRHKRSIEGKNFYSSIEQQQQQQQIMPCYLYTMINILLTYVRSYYPTSFRQKLNLHDMRENRKVHIRTLNLLARICHDLSFICIDTTSTLFINFIIDLLNKTALQKTILHLFHTAVEKVIPSSTHENIQQQVKSSETLINMTSRQQKLKTLSKTILDYNIEPVYDEFSRQYLKQLAQLLEEIVFLEHVVVQCQHSQKSSNDKTSTSTNAISTSNTLISVSSNGFGSQMLDHNSSWSSPISPFTIKQSLPLELDFISLLPSTLATTTLITKNTGSSPTTTLRYIDNQPVVNQSLFLSSILQYLKQIDFIENHRYIISLCIRILPHCGSSLKSIGSLVVEQMCRNLCYVVQAHHQRSIQSINIFRTRLLPHFDVIDYVIHLIQLLSYICNYCLLGIENEKINVQMSTVTLTQYWMKNANLSERDLYDARQSILNQLPSILSSLLFIWKTVSEQLLFELPEQTITTTINLNFQKQYKNPWPNQSVKQIRQTILELLSSLTKHNGISFMLAIAVCWGERKRQQRLKSTAQSPKLSTGSIGVTTSTILTMPRDNIGEIQALIDIVMNIKNYTINDIIANMNELIRNQLTVRDKKKQNYDVWCLQFLLAYLEQQKSLTVDFWPQLSFMFKECLSSQPISQSATFLILRILSFYVKRLPTISEKRDMRDLQDITMRVLDNCNIIVASSLQQTTWLRKNLQVRLANSDGTVVKNNEQLLDVPIAVSQTMISFDSSNTNYSLLALSILAEHAASLLDIVYSKIDEKERIVIPFLQNLVPNVIPYVKTHVQLNASSYRCASQLLMNLSQYSYTRKAWKKEAFEQLFDPSFFQLDIQALKSWKIIVDNLITNERPTSFRDVMTKINTIQTGLFISKEYEYEQRAMLVKRFAFVIYSSEKDQYNRQLPEILERITDLLKLPQMPTLHTQMFLFFRVLLLRIASRNLISLWPILMAELVQVLLQFEQDLLSDLDGEAKSHIQRLAMNDLASTTVSSTPSGQGLNPALKMYLFACKLLDVLLAMPYSELYHFQLFRSAFVSDEDGGRKTNTDSFIAFSARLSKLLERKLTLSITAEEGTGTFTVLTNVRLC